MKTLYLLPVAVLLVHGLTLLSTAAQNELVIYKEGTKLYHWPGCPVVKDGKGVMALRRAQAESRGYKPHPDCDPANQKTGGAEPVQGPVTVYLDSSKYYHRKSFAKLDKDPKAVKPASLEVAGKSHWPCPTCKPPIRRRSTEPALPGTGRGSP